VIDLGKLKRIVDIENRFILYQKKENRGDREDDRPHKGEGRKRGGGDE
jgi:hypothetical protein